MVRGGLALTVEEAKEGLVELTGVDGQRVRGNESEVETRGGQGR